MHLEPFWSSQARLWALLGTLWEPLRVSCSGVGAFLSKLAENADSTSLFDVFWSPHEPLGSLLEPLLGPLGASWAHLRASWSCLGAFLSESAENIERVIIFKHFSCPFGGP